MIDYDEWCDLERHAVLEEVNAAQQDVTQALERLANAVCHAHEECYIEDDGDRDDWYVSLFEGGLFMYGGFAEVPMQAVAHVRQSVEDFTRRIEPVVDEHELYLEEVASYLERRKAAEAADAYARLADHAEYAWQDSVHAENEKSWQVCSGYTPEEVAA